MTLDSAGEPRRVPGSPGERRCNGRPPCHVHVPSSTVVKHKPWRGRAVRVRETLACGQRGQVSASPAVRWVSLSRI
jgi:hypothetical protein